MTQQHAIIELYAGTRPDGEPVYEKIATRVFGDNDFQALHSPGFVRGLARGDHFLLVSRKAGSFEVTRRSGNLAVRVYSTIPVQSLDVALTPQVTQLEGRRDVMSDHLLVYSLPLEAGFDAIETTFEQALSGSGDARWSYGNVYDERSGEPLNWWLIRPQPSRDS